MKFSMNTIPMIGILAVMPFILVNATAAPGESHVHGEAQVDISLDGPVLEVALKSPLESLVGFEHAPRTKAQQRAMRDMTQAFRQPEKLFAPTAGAQCKAEPAAVSVPALKDAGHTHAADKDTHAELETTITFRCLVPTALRSIEFKLFGVFPRMQRIAVQFVGPKGQTAATLTPTRQSFSW